MKQDWVLDHITIAVRDLQKSRQLFENLLNGELIKEATLPEQNAVAAYYRVGDVMIGLEAPMSEEGDLYNFLQKKGEGIHHLAFHVENLGLLEADLREHDIKLIAFSEKTGLKKEFFTHPKSSLGLLLQFMEWEEPYKSSLQKRMDTVGEG